MQKIFDKMKDQFEFRKSYLSFNGLVVSVPVITLETAIEIVNQVAKEYKNKFVSLGAYKQVAWERDIAIEQLHELGYEFGQKIEEEYCDYDVHFAPSTDIYFTTKCGHRHNGYLNGSRAYCGFCGKKIKVVE